jgi:hypothetical protein
MEDFRYPIQILQAEPGYFSPAQSIERKQHYDRMIANVGRAIIPNAADEMLNLFPSGTPCDSFL